MQTTNTKTFAPKTKWSDEEVKTFFSLLPKYGSDFKQYVQHLNRTYSQIKSFYHNYLRRHRMGKVGELVQKIEHDTSNQIKQLQSNQETNLQSQQFNKEAAQMLGSLMDIMFNLQQ
ncbi:Conserved_hypothetical protein [Hexamita inflata]|uniref:HTH myb-type domain-containing protein n=1 Tax=Hexamita inflata TaxID=28002 RepID=A0AA86QDL4_9EUKA|nr:Conserved hypothetical protein [Hexamita inflata]